MKVRELIEFLQTCDQEAEVTSGNNFDNGIRISWGYAEGCTKEHCQFICIDPLNSDCNYENKNN
jgi:hypothetical protein